MGRDNVENDPRSAFDWALQAGEAGAVLGEIARLKRRQRSRRKAAALGAAVAVALAAGGAYFIRAAPFPAGTEHRELADGSVVDLKTNAHIEVAYSAGIRDIDLVNGAAHFKVAHNPLRPFVVHAGGIEVRAVGTQFTVDLGHSSIEVLVDEGKVAVEEPGRNGIPIRTYVSAGNRVVVDLPAAPAAGALAKGDPVPSAAEAAKLAPRMDFSATPLAEVVPVFNQYSGKRLVLADPSLGAVQISGVLRADKVDALLELLETNYGIKPQRDGEVIILGKSP